MVVKKNYKYNEQKHKSSSERGIAKSEQLLTGSRSVKTTAEQIKRIVDVMTLGKMASMRLFLWHSCSFAKTGVKATREIKDRGGPGNHTNVRRWSYDIKSARHTPLLFILLALFRLQVSVLTNSYEAIFLVHLKRFILRFHHFMFDSELHSSLHHSLNCILVNEKVLLPFLI